MTDPDRGKAIPPIIVFGADPSGPLLLCNYLGLHTHLEPIYDTGFVADVARHSEELGGREDEAARAAIGEAVEQWRASFWEDESPSLRLPFGPRHVTFLRELGPATERLLAASADPVLAARAFLEELFAVQLQWAQKLAWVNSSWRYVEALPQLARIFEDGIFLHVAHETAREPSPEGPARVLRVGYEDLLDDPVSELPRLCGELGLPDEGEKMVLIFENAVPRPEPASR